VPVLVGPSRKSFIGKVLDLPVGERLMGTAAAVAVSVLAGAHVVRVHDVREMVQVTRLCDAVLSAGSVVFQDAPRSASREASSRAAARSESSRSPQRRRSAARGVRSGSV
jgi:hypothetical protein